LRGEHGVHVVTTGMGPEAAARAAAAGLDGSIAAVVVTGLAGGCDPALTTGTVVLATGLCDLEGTAIDAPPPAPAVRDAVLAAAQPAVAGTVASVAAVVDDPATRDRLAAAGAIAVETEAAAWAAASVAAGIPMVVVRAVLDTPARPLGAAARLVVPGATGASAARLVGLATRPSAWAAVPRLARDAARAEARAATAAVAAAVAMSAGL
jgi:adenosylhomocysteine nucleosidase